MGYIAIDPKSIELNPYDVVMKEWALLSAGTAESCNTMTIGWGAIGAVWGQAAFTAYVRQSRYTKEFLDANDLFTVSFFGDQKRDALMTCGRKSGRDCDKVAEAGLTTVDLDGTVAFEGARLVLVCRKAFVQDMPAECFKDQAVFDKWYADGDLHTQYIGFIEAAYVQE